MRVAVRSASKPDTIGAQKHLVEESLADVYREKVWVVGCVFGMW